jgi:hypothetical protein
MNGYIVGPAARAIELTKERSRLLAGAEARPDWDASIALFFVNGPFHPFWSWWAVACVHLRDIEGAPPAKKHYPEAEYEFAIWSLDAGQPGSPKTKSGEPWDPAKDEDVDHWAARTLHPPDVVKHFHLPLTTAVEERDAIARHITEKAVAAILAGAASPDSDYRSWWKKAIDNTIEHVLTGGQHAKGAQA